MNYGFIKTAAATPSIRVADCEYNCGQILSLIERAVRDHVKILALPELTITGYTCGDLFLQPTLQRGAEQALIKIIQYTKELDLLLTVGVPLKFQGKLYNCCAVINRGKILGIVPKTHLPNYGEFYERRQFTPAPDHNSTITVGGLEYPFGNRLVFRCQELPDLCVGVEICEDLWVPVPPSMGHALAGATVIINCSASVETIGKADYRKTLVGSQSAKLACAYLYADAGEGESSTDLVFSGHNLIAENGSILSESPPFEGGYALTEIDLQKLCAERQRMSTFPTPNQTGYEQIFFSLAIQPTPLTRNISAHPFIPKEETARFARCREILTMQSAGLKKRLEHTGCHTAVVGISGGLDSCLALLVAVKAMDWLNRPLTDILAITMPCFGTTSRTRSNARLLCEALGVTFQEINIGKAVTQHFSDIGQDPSLLDVTYENAQARERTQVLMDLANQTGGLVIGTGDLSELALGWATYNGDHMSMYGVNASIPKTLVRYLVDYVASTTQNPALTAVLRDILDTPVSPELLPAENGKISQKTEDLVGPYELHDFFLYYFIRFGCTPEKILYLAKYAFAGRYDEATVRHWLNTFLRRFFAQQFKRSCLPDGPKVGTVSLSPRGDWRMPSDACANLWLNQILKQ